MLTDGDGRSGRITSTDTASFTSAADLRGLVAELRRCRRPARQLALPAPFVEPRPGLCCPIGDYPNYRGLIDPVFLLSVGAARGAPVVGESLDGSELLAAHDPLGGMHERKFHRCFVVRPAMVELPGEYAWPACELYREGAADTD